MVLKVNRKIEEGLLEYRPIDFKKVGSLLIFLQESSFRPLEVLSWLKDRLWKYSQGVEDWFWKSTNRLKRSIRIYAYQFKKKVASLLIFVARNFF